MSASYHVLYNSETGDWRVVKQRSSRASAVEPTKAEAVKTAKELARNNKPSEVNIHYRSADSQLDPVQNVVSYGR